MEQAARAAEARQRAAAAAAGSGNGDGHALTSVNSTPELQFPQGLTGTPADLLREQAQYQMFYASPNAGGECAPGAGSGWPTDNVFGHGAVASGNGNGFTETNYDYRHGHAHGQGQGLQAANGSAAASAVTALAVGPASPSSVKAKGPATINAADLFGERAQDLKGKRASGLNSGHGQSQGQGGQQSPGGADEGEGLTVKVLVESGTPGEPPKRVKMHQCRICQKLFPRPSGLATHMNSHSGARRECSSPFSLL